MHLELLSNLRIKGNFVTTFIPNRCTDILATCDGGVIKLIQDEFHKKLSLELETHYDEMNGTDYLSKKKLRFFIIKTMNEAITLVQTEIVQKIARRCGSLFCLKKNLKDQFSNVKLRGYTEGLPIQVNGKKTWVYKNVFSEFDEEKSENTRKSW